MPDQDELDEPDEQKGSQPPGNSVKNLGCLPLLTVMAIMIIVFIVYTEGC